MNTLSILLYLANVLPSLSAALGVTGVILIVGWVVYHFFSGDLIDGPFYNIKEGKYSLKTPLLGFALGIFATLFPSERTIYLIAASEMGEVVVTDPETIEIFDLLKETVKTKLEEVVESE